MQKPAAALRLLGRCSAPGTSPSWSCAALCAELFTALGTAAAENVAAISGGHAGTEAVHLAALPLLGLESTYHDNTSLSFYERPAGRLCVLLQNKPVLLYGSFRIMSRFFVNNLAEGKMCARGPHYLLIPSLPAAVKFALCASEIWLCHVKSACGG